MMYEMNNNNNPKTLIGFYAVMVIIFILVIGFLSSCKTRKLDKVVDRSETKTELRKTETVKDSAKVLVKIDVKEAVKSNETFDAIETTKIYKDSTIIVKQTKAKRDIITEKSDQSKTDLTFNNTKVNQIDSLVSEKKDVINKNVKTTSYLGFAIFLILVGVFLIWFFGKKYLKA